MNLPLGQTPELDQIVKLAGAFTVIASAVGVVISLCMGGPSQVKKAFKGFWDLFVWITSFLHVPWTIGPELRRIHREMEEFRKLYEDTDRNVKYLLSEQTANGWTSQKDISLLLLGQWKSDKRRTRYPIFLSDSDGRNIVVSRTFCDMVGIHQEEELLGLDWKRFVFHEDVDAYFRKLIAAIETRSSFRAVARFVDVNASVLGTWEAVGETLIKEQKSRVLYEVTLRPLDALAKRIACDKAFTYYH